MFFAELFANLLELLVGAAAIGLAGKLMFPHSWLFRSNRHPKPH
jgi:hypothetical protein